MEVDLKQKDLKHAIAGLLVEILLPVAAVSVSNATRFFFADVDGDGRADKMYWNPGIYLGEMKVHYSKTTNSFDSPVYNLLANSESSGTEYYFADINGDGKKDLIRWNYGQNNGALKNFLAR